MAPILIFTKLIIVFIGACPMITASPSPPCPSLSVLPGTVVLCNLPSTNQTIDCLDPNAEIPRGTLAKYKCERDTSFSEAVLKCRCRGRWRGVKLFNDFMSKCNISDYSLEGPPELNLTDRQIRQLSLVGVEPENVTGQIFKVDFQEDGVAYHNFYRKIHHSPPLKLNETLSNAAQKWADQQVSEPFLKTQPWSDRWYSQNLYRIAGTGIDVREAVRLAVAAWYQAAYSYDWENPSGQSAFTQVVWKSTTDLGIGVSHKNNYTVVVANYWPPGNIIVENPDITDKWAWFRVNVFPPNAVNGTTYSPANVGETSTSTTESTTTIN